MSTRIELATEQPIELDIDVKGVFPESEKVASHEVRIASEDEDDRDPTEEELATLRKVAAPMPWAAVAMCLIEFSERASYYGCSFLMGNFIRNKLPHGGNGAGAVAPGELGLSQSAGALGLGTQKASAITTLFKFLAYTIPILGGIVADTKWGRFKTICVGTAVGAFAHILLVVPAIPSIISKPDASFGLFIVSIVILAFAAGFIKPCLGPLLCDQSPISKPTLHTLKSGERVILDPQVTVARYLQMFYWAINVGAFFSLATTYAEHDIGFWLGFLLPGIIYCLMPIVLVIAYKRLYKAPPQGSVLVEASSVVKRLLKGGNWKRAFKGGDVFWDSAKPSVIEATEGTIDRTKIIWDDKFVDELRQTFAACQVFLLIPIFVLADGGFGDSEGAMSAVMVNNGVPNDLISNFNSLTIVIFTPILTFGLYPLLERRGINFTPMWRMSVGFLLASINMIIGAVLQWRVYKTSPCGWYASDCKEISTVNLWWQIPLYSLPAIGELLVNITSYEIAYTRAPARMKGLVYAMVLFTSAISAAITQIVNPALKDPYLVWPYVALAVACFICAGLFPTVFKHLDTPIVFADPDRMEGKQQYNYQPQAALPAYEEESPSHERKQ